MIFHHVHYVQAREWTWVLCDPSVCQKLELPLVTLASFPGSETGNEIMPSHLGRTMLELFHGNLPCVLLQHQCLQAVSTQKEERRETRGRVVWATFETGDANGMYLSWPPLSLSLYT